MMKGHKAHKVRIYFDQTRVLMLSQTPDVFFSPKKIPIVNGVLMDVTIGLEVKDWESDWCQRKLPAEK